MINISQRYQKSEYVPEVACENQPLNCVNQKEELQQIYKGSIVAIMFKMNNKNSYGSGVFISSNLILTAAHNLYADQKNYSIAPSLQNRKETFKIYVKACGSVTEKPYEVEDWSFLNEYKQCQASRVIYDYALIKIKGHMNQKAFPKLSIIPIQCINGKINQPRIKIYGYPRYGGNYQSEGNTIKLNQYGRQKENGILEIEDHKMKYTITTYGGHSGAPVAIGDNIIGIHLGGDRQKKQFNFARLINLELLTNLKIWSQQMNGQAFEVDYEHLRKYAAKFTPQYKQQLRNFLTKKGKGKDEDIRWLKEKANQLNLKFVKLNKQFQQKPIMQAKKEITKINFGDIWMQIKSMKLVKRQMIPSLSLKATVLLLVIQCIIFLNHSRTLVSYSAHNIPQLKPYTCELFCVQYSQIEAVFLLVIQRILFLN